MSNQVDKNKKLLTEQETARRLGIHPRTLARHRREGNAPPHVKRGRSYFYREVGREAYLPVTCWDRLCQGFEQINGRSWSDVEAICQSAGPIDRPTRESYWAARMILEKANATGSGLGGAPLSFRRTVVESAIDECRKVRKAELANG